VKFELGATEACCTRLNSPFPFFTLYVAKSHSLFGPVRELGPRFMASLFGPVLGAGFPGKWHII
jgi:hypothetical protein